MADSAKNEKVQELDFETAYQRLEEILEVLNTSGVGLDKALKLYEEADKLILFCQKRLNDAEKKIEVLIKNRSGDVALGPNGKPQTQEFA